MCISSVLNQLPLADKSITPPKPLFVMWKDWWLQVWLKSLPEGWSLCLGETLWPVIDWPLDQPGSTGKQNCWKLKDGAAEVYDFIQTQMCGLTDGCILRLRVMYKACVIILGKTPEIWATQDENTSLLFIEMFFSASSSTS